MKLNLPWSKDRLKSHFQYGSWKYLLLIVLSFFVWDLIYSATAYRPPQDKRIDLYIQSVTASQEDLQHYFEEIRADVVPDMELVSTAMLMGTTQSDIYAAQQLTTYLMAGEGDIYILTGPDFKQYASQGVFLRLDELIEQGKLDNAKDLQLNKGMVAIQEYDSDTEEMVTVSANHLYGIPMESLFGFLTDLNIDNRDRFLAVTIFNQNDENVLKFLNELIGRTNKPLPPDWELHP